MADSCFPGLLSIALCSARHCHSHSSACEGSTAAGSIQKSRNVYGLILPLFENVLGVPCVYRAESFKTAGEGPEVTATNSEVPLVCCINLFTCCLWSGPEIHW